MTQVRSYVRAGLLAPHRGPGGEFCFSFQDIAFLRVAKNLLDARVPRRRVSRALRRLREQLPAEAPLSSVSIDVVGSTIMVRDDATLWNPESGQVQLDFSGGASSREVTALEARRAQLERAWGEMDAAEWFNVGVNLESHSADEAKDAYQRSLELDPTNSDTYVNLGRLFHDEGEVEHAIRQYRAALLHDPQHVTAAFNLGIALEDLDKPTEAIASYEQALASDPSYADAHFNLARAHERMGDRAAALRHMRSYKELLDR